MTIQLDPTVYSGAPADMSTRSAVEQKTYAFLDKLGIEYSRI